MIVFMLFCHFSIIMIFFCCLCAEKDDRVMIMYISRGLLSSLTEARDVLDTIAYHNNKLHFNVIINTYAVIDGEIFTQFLIFLFCL